MTAAPQHPTSPQPGRSRPLLWVSLLGLALTACAPARMGPDPNLGWTEAGSPKALEVDRAEYRHAVYFDTDQARISGLEQDRLSAFLASIHADERATDLYNVELAARRNESVDAFLREQGLSDLTVTSSAFGEAVPAVAGSGPQSWQQNRRVELVLERYLVTLPPCPDWSRQSGTDFANLPHSNFGCATQTNLGLMVAEPRDLVRGRGLAPADGVHQAEGIVRYRTGKVVELEEEKVEN
jgi:pilus assembly protein CpaD